MKKLKSLIEAYGRWEPLSKYILRIETYAHQDFSIAFENSKSLLESISKEICFIKNEEIGKTENISGVLKKACRAIGYTNSDLVTQLSTSIGNIGQQMGNLRNEIGVTAHGKTMEELRNREENISEFTRDFLIDTTELVACFLIRAFENENPRNCIKVQEQVAFDDNERFNDFWDEIFGDYDMGDYSYTASEILYNMDYQAYESESKNYYENLPNEEM